MAAGAAVALQSAVVSVVLQGLLSGDSGQQEAAMLRTAELLDLLACRIQRKQIRTVGAGSAPVLPQAHPSAAAAPAWQLQCEPAPLQPFAP